MLQVHALVGGDRLTPVNRARFREAIQKDGVILLERVSILNYCRWHLC